MQPAMLSTQFIELHEVGDNLSLIVTDRGYLRGVVLDNRQLDADNPDDSELQLERAYRVARTLPGDCQSVFLYETDDWLREVLPEGAEAPRDAATWHPSS